MKSPSIDRSVLSHVSVSLIIFDFGILGMKVFSFIYIYDPSTVKLN